MRTHTPRFLLPALTAGLTAGLLTLAGCGAAASDTAAEAPDPITVDEAWVKAAEDGMTAAFGQITNTGEEDVTLTEVESSVSDDIELHQTSEDGTGGMSMEEKEGGFLIAAGDTLDLSPGGDHIMFMDFDGPLSAGDTVDLTLIFADGSEVEFDAQIRDFAGAEESYDDDHSGHEHSDHDEDA